MGFASAAVPLLALLFCLWDLAAGRDVFSDFLEGAKQGMQTLAGIAPATFALCFALAFFRSSGALDLLCHALAAPLALLGLPAETAPLVLMRPVSGAGASTLFHSILQTVGPDSFAGRVASVLMGASDTTLYTLTLYFSQTRVKTQRGALTAALIGDLAAFCSAAAAVRLLFYS